MATSTARNYWEFLDEAQGAEPIRIIRSNASKGDDLIASFKRNPVVPFGGFSIDFASMRWDFSAVTQLNVHPSNLRISFSQGEHTDLAKAYLLCTIVWKRAKVQTLVEDARVLMRIFGRIETPAGKVELISIDNVSSYFEAIRVKKSPSTLSHEARVLCSFLEFYEILFSPIVDPDVIPWLNGYSREQWRLSAQREGWPAIPYDYLNPLLDACETAIESNTEEDHMKIVAAAILLISQTGLRAGELLGAEANALEVSKGVKGKPDITYMRYRTYKGEPGDGSSRIGKTIINSTALRAYLYLEEHCKARRDELGVPTLIVFPKQRVRYCNVGHFLPRFRLFLLRYCDAIPCIGTQDDYPEFSTATVGSVLNGRPLSSCARSDLRADDVLVYPVIHSFRVTVATKLHEAGVDMHYIREHMNQFDENTTIGYIRSDRQVEKEKSSLVYRSIFEDGAELLGDYAQDFMDKVNAYVDTLDSQVKENVDAIVEAAARQFPLRSKVGGICIRCGNVAPCPTSDGTDQILCAFGVCPNQCQMYFMAYESLEMARTHMRLVKENESRGHAKAAANELRKAQNIIRDVLVPELSSLDRQVEAWGEDEVIRKFPALEEIVLNRRDIDEEVAGWMAKSL